MRFMMMVRSNPVAESGQPPSPKLLATMQAYNEQLQKAGVLRDLAGLKPSAAGFRLHYANGEPTLHDGPFAETRELIAGFWIIETKTRDEALAWAKKIPAPFEDGSGVIEVRPLWGPEDFGPPAQ